MVSFQSTPQEIPLPEFVLTKASVHWSEEDHKAYKDYEKKVQELTEEKEKYKRVHHVTQMNLGSVTRPRHVLSSVFTVDGGGDEEAAGIHQRCNRAL